MQRSIGILILAVGLAPLGAQDMGSASGSSMSIFNTQSRVGIQGFLVSPQGDLRDAVGGRTGFQVGAHWSIGYDGGGELRPRVDYTRFDGGSLSFSSTLSTTTLQGVGVGVDYLRYLDGSHLGFYVLAGASINWWDASYRFASDSEGTYPAAQVGVGHRFNQALAVEFDVGYGPFRPSMGAGDTIKLGAFYKF
ncbi:MAG: hypothetical protein P4L36_19605 [Holophaga sp.]|nr:hypothetical protein [Holophaga sp.]